MKKLIKSTVGIVLSIVMIFSCFSVLSAASGVTILKQPTTRSYYQGIDWTYSKTKEFSWVKNIDLTGTQLSYNGNTVTFTSTKWGGNMYSKLDSGTWSEGDKTIRIYCDDFPSTVYGTTTVHIVPVKSISIVTPPSQTIYIKDKDWRLGIKNDVEFTSCDLTGLVINVTYTDGTQKKVSASTNKLVGWSVDTSKTYIFAGDNILYATFGGQRAAFDVQFLETYPKGDVSNDAKINSYDALLILQCSTGSVKLSAANRELADVNSDKEINSSDALLVLQYVVGKIKKL